MDLSRNSRRVPYILTQQKIHQKLAQIETWCQLQLGAGNHQSSDKVLWWHFPCWPNHWIVLFHLTSHSLWPSRLWLLFCQHPPSQQTVTFDRHVGGNSRAHRDAALLSQHGRQPRDCHQYQVHKLLWHQTASNGLNESSLSYKYRMVHISTHRIFVG